MAAVTANPVTLILRNKRERLRINVSDSATDTPIAPAALRLTVTDLADNPLHVDAFPELTLTGTLSTTVGSDVVEGTGTRFNTELVVGDTFSLASTTYTVSRINRSNQLVVSSAATAAVSNGTATRPTRIQNPAAGEYFIEWGDPAAPANSSSSGQTETNCLGTVLAVWEVEDSSTDLSVVAQSARIISGRTLSLLPGFRKLIDKAVKEVDDANDCFLGYTDGQLIQYLEEGLTIINAYEPYPTFCRLEEFPLTYLYVLYEAALLAGVMSQQLFAIDTDIPNYSDQGNSFVIQHAPQLAQVFQTISARLDKIIPLMKLKFVRTGSLHIQAGPNYRLAQLISSAPNGSLFRNVYFAGS